MPKSFQKAEGRFQKWYSGGVLRAYLPSKYGRVFWGDVVSRVQEIGTGRAATLVHSLRGARLQPRSHESQSGPTPIRHRPILLSPSLRDRLGSKRMEKMGAADSQIEDLLAQKKRVKNPLVPIGISPTLLKFLDLNLFFSSRFRRFLIHTIV